MSLLIGVGVIAMVVFVAVRAWPMFEHNGLSWVSAAGDFETEINKMTAATTNPAASVFHLRAWPVIYGTLLTTAIALVLGLTIAVLSSVFIVELAPARVTPRRDPDGAPARVGAFGDLRADRDPRARAVRGQPPDHPAAKESMQGIVQLTGAGLGVTAATPVTDGSHPPSGTSRSTGGGDIRSRAPI